ncbi:UDP-N-acetylglucosamine 2-epimerase [Clostridium nigeriense]|uniref:UDP-N-acetylglucosamine 2-epimerase n=1 Tax=Clostridium nigeriense TaxID=1805470 RepID=UPI00082A925A|nr:UDP-N-acetylglucosamine 2-epimerase [Clostridium nigeriense]
MKKVCVVTGTRAEYGLLKPLIDKINKDNDLELQLIVTGMHLSPEFGMTYNEIIDDGYKVNEKIEILLSSDTPVGISKSMGLATISFAEAFERLKPDMLVVLGDRFEIFAVCSSAVVAKIPIAHLHGGETTEGAFDEAFRHSITKMSYLHFTSTEEYKKRVIQLGENPQRVFNVGAIGVENIAEMELMSKEELEKSIGFDLGNCFSLVTFHPVTLENSTSEEQIKELLNALDSVDGMKYIITKANSDSDGRIINKIIDEYCVNNKEKVISFTSMGYKRYLSAMKYCDMVIGNSSSGIIEAPSFKKATINIGDRQKGRTQAKSIINCKPIINEIVESINYAKSDKFKDVLKNVINPYGNGETSEKIIIEIKKVLNKPIDIKKSFYNIEF